MLNNQFGILEQNISSELPVATSNCDVIDLEEALENLGGSLEFLKELAEVLINEVPNALSKIRQAIQQRDSKALMISAHTLKGAVSNFSAHRASKLARDLEYVAKKNNLENTGSMFSELELEMGRLIKRLKDL